MSLDSILVSSMVSVSGPYTELHECVISIVLVLVHKCIVYQQIVEICCEVLTFYCCNKYCLLPLVSYRNMHFPIVLCCGTQRALFTNKIIIRLVSNHETLPVYEVLCMYVFRLLSYRSLHVVL